MPLFRTKHKTEVYNSAGANWNWTCSCGAHGRAIPHKAEMEKRARLHEQSENR